MESECPLTALFLKAYINLSQSQIDCLENGFMSLLDVRLPAPPLLKKEVVI